MNYSQEVEKMCTVAKGPNHGPAPIPEEGKWVKSYEIKDISGLSHGVGWCAPQQGACKLTLNVKDGIVEEALVETLGCSGMTHSAAMAAEILPGNTHLIPAVAQFLTKRRELCGQCPDGFSPRFHTKVDAAAKSLQIPVKADACQWR